MQVAQAIVSDLLAACCRSSAQREPPARALTRYPAWRSHLEKDSRFFPSDDEATHALSRKDNHLDW